MKIEKPYQENGIKITRIDEKKSRKKSVINSKSKRAPFTGRPPGGSVISSIYKTIIDLEAQTQKDGRSSNRMKEGRRDWC